MRAGLLQGQWLEGRLHRVAGVRCIAVLGVVFVALTILMLGGCSGSGHEALQDWMARQRAQSRPAPEPVPPPRPFHPAGYPGDTLSDPFSPQKLTQVLQRESAASGSTALVLPERRRPRQPLEEFPLDSMTMVGSIARQGGRVALVRIGQVVHTVPPGAYLGHNYGKVMKVTENQLVLREIVQDTSGGWVERAATLQLQEASK